MAICFNVIHGRAIARSGGWALALFLIAVLPGSARAEQNGPLISSINGWIGASVGWSSRARTGTGQWINVNNGHAAPLPDPCELVALCYVIGKHEGRRSGADWQADARLSLPIGANLGLQIDSAWGHAAGLSKGTARGHFFFGASDHGGYFVCG